jgi:CheY-like chemotaxis protein
MADDQHVVGPDEQRQMARQHVFVVNGSPPFLDIMRELLQDERYNVTTTNFVPRTFEQIEALQPALLVIDIVVGEQAGWDLLERLHREASTNRMPVLVVSTDPGLLDRAQEQTERYGGQAYLAKPFDLEEMLRVIQGLIGLA